MSTKNSPTKSNTMLEKKLVFLAGATAPPAPTLCTALQWTKFERNSIVTFISEELP